MTSGSCALSAVPARSDPVAFQNALGDVEFASAEDRPDTGRFCRSYFPAVHGDRDCSFVIKVGDTVSLICLCAPIDGKLSFYGRPIRLVHRKSLGPNAYSSVLNFTFGYLDQLAIDRELHETLVVDEGAGLEAYCVARGATATSSSIACVDLVAGPAAWRAALRKSSRSLINWGRRNFSIKFVNREFPDREMFERYRMFHASVSGRVTRPKESWDIMCGWITSGGGELILAFLGEDLVAGSMFIDTEMTSEYASGVYDRTRFDRPLAHYPVWLGIEHARERGMTKLELGVVPSQGSVPQKEYQIGYFKRGFATHFEEQRVWHWTVNL